MQRRGLLSLISDLEPWPNSEWRDRHRAGPPHMLSCVYAMLKEKAQNLKMKDSMLTPR
jgi:hypothetical protein